jgi:hypothetical protein
VHRDEREEPVSQPDAETLGAGSSRRRLVEIRCGFAQLSRQEANAAEARAAEARVAYGEQLALVTRLAAEANPGAKRIAKETAHREFRTKIGAAQTHSQVEMAATAWLEEINRINGSVRAQQARTKHERELAERLSAELDRLTGTAETGRVLADAAQEACRAAQLGLAAFDLTLGDPATGEAAAALIEAQAAGLGGRVAPGLEAGTPSVSVAPSAQAEPSAPMASPLSRAPRKGVAVPAPPEPRVEFRGPHPPTVARLLRRDRAAMNRLVDALAGSDLEQRRWQLLLSNFVDAVAAAAIDSGCFEFPAGNKFWDQFAVEEGREVARGVAVLGFRYDGISQFADGRVPDKRDLAMAVGQAGLHQVLVRFWPTPEETGRLFDRVRVDTDELLAEGAPSLTLGELVRLLGWRAELLADLWNDWPSVRPLLLAASPT